MSQETVSRAERAGETVGRGYARATGALAGAVRRAPAPRWPRHRVRAGVVAVGRRVRNVPARLLDGLRTLLARRKGDGAKTRKRRLPRRATVGTTLFLGWWGWAWAADEGVLPWLYTAAAVAAAGTVYAAGSEPAPAPAEPHAEPAGEPDEPAPEQPQDPLLKLCADLTGTARGVHLNALVTALNQAAPNRARTAAEVRTALAQRGVPTRPSVRAPKGAAPGAPEGVTRGVHRDDLEAVYGPLPAPPAKTTAEPVATAATPPATSNVAAGTTSVAAHVAAPATAHADPK